MIFKFRKRRPSAESVSKNNKDSSNYNNLDNLKFDLMDIKQHLGVSTPTIEPLAPPIHNETENEQTDEFQDIYDSLSHHLTELLQSQISQQTDKMTEKIENYHALLNKTIEKSLEKQNNKPKNSKIEELFTNEQIQKICPNEHKDYIKSLYQNNDTINKKFNTNSRTSSINFDLEHLESLKNTDIENQDKTDKIDYNILANKMSEIMKLNNQTHNNCLLDDNCTLFSNPNNIRFGLVANQVKTLKYAIPFDISQVGCTKFFKTLHHSKFKSMTQQEYNLLIANLVGPEMQKKLAAHKITPNESTTINFLNDIYRLAQSENIDEMVIERKLHEYTSTDCDISKIISEISNLLENVSSDIWSENTKAKKLFFTVKKSLPQHFLIHLDNLIRYDHIIKKNIYPSRDEIKGFLLKHSINIDKELQNKKYNRRINMVDQKHNFDKSINMIETKDIDKSSITQDNESLNTKFNYQNNPNNFKLNYKPQSYRNDYEHNTQNGYNRYQDNNNRYQDNNKYQENNPNNYRKNYQGQYKNNYTDNYNTDKRNTRPTYQSRPFSGPPCTECKRFGHNSASCFFHSDINIAILNQKARCRRCLLCSEEKHNSNECEKYNNIKPIPFLCTICKDNNILNYHPINSCLLKK